MLENTDITTNDNHKKIRSFVKRNGRVTKNQTFAISNFWDKHVLQPQNKEKINFLAEFSNNNPVVLEVGFGNGASLIEMAQSNPNKNFIGIEVYKSGVGAALAKIEELSLKNVKLICDDAVQILENNIPDKSLSKVQLFFPDPWHKKRHHKRRIVNANFAKLLHTKMLAGGIFHLATDWENYAEHMLEVLENSEYFINKNGENAFAESTDRPKTKFEQRGIRLGHGIWDLEYQA